MDNHTHIQPQKNSPVTFDDLAHIASCTYCSKQFADFIEESGLLHAPKNMKESILEKSGQTDIKLIAKTNQVSKKLQLFYYSLKVGFATVFALSLLVWFPGSTPISNSYSVFQESKAKTTEHIYNQSKKITHIINELFQVEVSFYDKQEK